MFRFLLRVTTSDKIRNEYTRRTAQMECFETKLERKGSNRRVCKG